jgi:hypothetical protein
MLAFRDSNQRQGLGWPPVTDKTVTLLEVTVEDSTKEPTTYLPLLLLERPALISGLFSFDRSRGIRFVSSF